VCRFSMACTSSMPCGATFLTDVRRTGRSANEFIAVMVGEVVAAAMVGWSAVMMRGTA